ncbi:MAG: hydroxyethylthiazole kinase, partial [Burkholderiales bacterium]|nr:hydroxyethylthiazole kinase [Burkholderiales bacterium]
MSDLHTIPLIPQFPLYRVGEELARLRAAAPLVHCLSNEVVQSITANVLLALGASPAMIVAEEEVAEFAAIADALLINVGTLYPSRLLAMQKAVTAA